VVAAVAGIAVVAHILVAGIAVVAHILVAELIAVLSAGTQAAVTSAQGT
jgi:hypothetical protein